MKLLWEWIQRGYLRIIAPIGDFLARKNVNPNAITTFGTLCTLATGVIFATGHIRTAGWFLGITALFDVLDGTVARRTGRSTTFGAFYDSTLDRVADGALLGGLTVFFARNDVHHTIPSAMGTPMVGVLLLGIVGTFLTSYTRARAEALGIELKNVGILQRPERITLLSAPQAFFGLTLNGWVLIAICVLLSVTAWVTAVQRILHVYRETSAERPRRARAVTPIERAVRPTPEPVLRGDLPEPASYSTRPPR
jgi:CDP-diacylglycerol--glycerol-3-phosphate 3-phosphatidyltransferase